MSVMKLILTEKNCKDCGVALSEYESNEYGSLCLHCFRDEYGVPKKKDVMLTHRVKVNLRKRIMGSYR